MADSRALLAQGTPLKTLFTRVLVNIALIRHHHRAVETLTGGLGKLMEVDGYETWQCICDHSCAWESSTDPQDSWFCFLYHETNEVLTPRGPNSLLKLVAPSPCWTNRTNSSAGGHAETFANFGAVLDHMLDHW